jgi:hypothetical protein
MTIRSERTLVPPVTADRSPPDSRMTGADSPVIADSSTLAMPSMTSPSPGMRSPASATTMSPSLSSVAGMATSRPSLSSRATASCLAARSAAACALPRPSATASARLAKTTVSQSQTVMVQASTLESTMDSTVVKTAPTSTMNMTGLRHRERGSSLTSASGSDLHSCWGSSRPPLTADDVDGVAGFSASNVMAEPLSSCPSGPRLRGRFSVRLGAARCSRS